MVPNSELNERYPLPLLPLVDRPFLQHVVEFCISQGVKQFDFVLSHLPEKIEALLEDGKRWGSRFTFHLARDPLRPYRLLRILDLQGQPGEPLLLGHADRLPQMRLQEASGTGVLPLLFGWRDKAAADPESRRWTGWALLAPDRLTSLPSDPDEAELEAYLRANVENERGWSEVGRPLSVASYAEILESQRAVLAGTFPGLLLSGWEIKKEAGFHVTDESLVALRADGMPEAVAQKLDPLKGKEFGPQENFAGALAKLLDKAERKRFQELVLKHVTKYDNTGLWLSRNVKLHPTVKHAPPAYVCDNSSVDGGVELGPNVVVGNDCLLDTGCTASNALIFPGTYVSELLELTDVLLDKNLLINARLGVELDIDEFIPGNTREGHFLPGLTGLFRWVVAVLLLLLTSPVLLLTMLCLFLFRRGPVWHRKEVVRLPAPKDQPRWRTFKILSFSPDFPPGIGVRCGFRALLLRFLPALINVVKGELAFVGLPPRTPEEIGNLSRAWKRLYLRGKAGIITEGTFSGPNPTEDELYAADAFYAATATWRYDLKLLLRFLARSLFPFRRSRVIVDVEEGSSD